MKEPEQPKLQNLKKIVTTHPLPLFPGYYLKDFPTVEQYEFKQCLQALKKAAKVNFNLQISKINFEKGVL